MKSNISTAVILRRPCSSFCGWIWLATVALSVGAGMAQSGDGNADSFQRVPNPAAAGLWVGNITVRAVTYPPTGDLPATQSSAQLKILLHVDATGNVRLLKDAIVASKEGATFAAAVITKPSLVSSLPLQRDVNNAVKGQRFSTVAFDFTDNDTHPDDNALELTGGLGQNFECVGTLMLDKSHPTNPFRHKFHPDHANEGAKAYIITRSIQLQFSAPITNIAGVDQLSGTYQETVQGLHRAPLTVQGTLTLKRVATSSVLNQ